MFDHVFAPYFDILGTCVQVHPEWIGFFWGTVRLVFKVSALQSALINRTANRGLTMKAG